MRGGRVRFGIVMRCVCLGIDKAALPKSAFGRFKGHTGSKLVSSKELLGVKGNAESGITCVLEFRRHGGVGRQ